MIIQIFYDSSVKVQGMPGFHKSNIPKAEMPLDDEYALTVGYKGILQKGQKHNVKLDERQLEYSDVIHGIISGVKGQDGLKRKVITNDQHGYDKVKSYQSITNEEAAKNQFNFGLRVTDKRLEYLKEKDEWTWNKLYESAQENYWQKQGLTKPSRAERKEIQERHAIAAREAMEVIREAFDPKTRKYPEVQADGLIPKFHEGGIVPYQNVDSKGEVLAKLLPGEMVVPRDKVAEYAMNFDAMNNRPTNLAQEVDQIIPNYFSPEEISTLWNPEFTKSGNIRGGAFKGIGKIEKDGITTVVARDWDSIMEDPRFADWEKMSKKKPVEKTLFGGKSGTPLNELSESERALELNERASKTPEEIKERESLLKRNRVIESDIVSPKQVAGVPYRQPRSTAANSVIEYKQLTEGALALDKLRFAPMEQSAYDTARTGTLATPDYTSTHITLGEAKKIKTGWAEPEAINVPGKDPVIIIRDEDLIPKNRAQFIEMERNSIYNGLHKSIEGEFREGEKKGVVKSSDFETVDYKDLNPGNILVKGDHAKSIEGDLGKWWDSNKGPGDPQKLKEYTSGVSVFRNKIFIPNDDYRIFPGDINSFGFSPSGFNFFCLP